MTIAFISKLGVIALVFASTAMVVALVWESVRRRALQQRLRQLDELPVRPSQPGESSGWIESVARTTGTLSKFSGSEESAAQSELRLKLIQAGWRNPAVPIAFFGVKTLLVIVCPLVMASACLLMSEQPDLPIVFLLAVVGAGVGLFVPDMVLNAAIRSRQSQLLKEFPDALDLMTVCLEAGLSLEAALVRVSGEMSVSHALLSQELNLVVLEMRAGRPRDEALRNLARRSSLNAIESFVATLTQAERFGGSVSDAIRVYSDTLRIQRRQGAEEQAAKIGTKLTLPLVVCILPVIFMVMAGPAMLAVYEALSGDFGGK